MKKMFYSLAHMGLEAKLKHFTKYKLLIIDEKDPSYLID